MSDDRAKSLEIMHHLANFVEVGNLLITLIINPKKRVRKLIC